jgi:hypothetical protein
MDINRSLTADGVYKNGQRVADTETLATVKEKKTDTESVCLSVHTVYYKTSWSYLQE